MSLVGKAPRQIHVHIKVDTSRIDSAVVRITRSMRTLDRAATKATRVMHRLHPALCKGPRCPACHPLANPIPLSINGAAYRARSRRRPRR